MPGITFMPDLTEKAVVLAKEYGVGIVSIKNSGGVDALSPWLLDIPSHDCIGLFAWNGGSYTTVPFGSTEPFFGTNPIAYAIPTSDEPLLLDMSTSEIPFMDLMQAIQKGVSLPERAGLDELGRVTTDASRVYDIDTDSDVKLLPMGGSYKGSAIMLLVEIITGAFIDSKMAREATSSTQIPEEFGGVLVAIDIATFTSPSLFKVRVTNMIRQIRLSQPAPGFANVRVPGDKSYEREQNRLHSGTICLEETLVAELRQLAHQQK
jgi:LDH2 family malate/lactate/ureidoglycolate dehydrogenase